MSILKTGDAIDITYDGRNVEGTVILASSNGKSLMIEFEAVLGGFVGRMPISMADDGTYHEMSTGHPIDLKKR